MAPFHVSENRPLLSGTTGACALAMTGALMAADHDGNSTVLFVGGIIIVITAVVIVLGSDSLAVVIAASIKGTTGMALLAQSYGHGVAMGAAVYLALTGLMATWLLSAIVNRLGPLDWSRLGGLARQVPRDKPDQQEKPVPLEKQDQQDKQGQLGKQDPLVKLVKLVRPALLDKQDQLEKQVQLDNWVLQVFKEIQVPQVQQVTLDQQVLQV